MNEQMSGDETEQVQLYSWNRDKAISQPATNDLHTHTHTHKHVQENTHFTAHTQKQTQENSHTFTPHTPHTEQIKSRDLLWVLKKK